MKIIKVLCLCVIIFSVIFATERDFKDSNSNGKWDPGENLLKSTKDDKFITIGGAVTEIVFDLGFGNSGIAVDQSSTFPPKVKDLPEIGYIRMISSERVLSKFPKKIFTTKDISPKTVIAQLKESPADFKVYDSPKTIDGTLLLIDQLSSELGVQDLGEILKNDIGLDIKRISNIASGFKSKPKIVFFMNPSAGSYVAAGSGTSANYLINLIGGDNIFSEDFKSYQKVSKETIFIENPDVILVASHNSEQSPTNHFNALEFEILSSVKNNNIIEINMSDLTMGTSFAFNALSILNKINYESK